MARKKPGKERFKAPQKGTTKITRPPSSSRLYWVMALIAVLVLAGGYVLYHFQEQHVRQRVNSELIAVAQLKTEQIADWRNERLMDASMFAAGQFLPEEIAEFKASPTDTELREQILASLAVIAKFHPYQDILVVDVDGSVLVSLNDRVHRLDDMTLVQLAAAIKAHEAVMVDFHYPADGDPPQLDVVAPLFRLQEDSQPAMGALILCIDPSQYLWPLVQSWPMPSETAETLLFERDGDQVLFLNELRHQQDTALKLRAPLSEQKRPVVMAVLGKEGVVEGKDYRGVEVLAALKHVPDSPWYIEAKIDTSEALSAWRSEAVLIVASFAVLLGVALALAGFIWQRRRRQAYEALYQAEIESQALRSHFEYLVKYANDIILLVDGNYKIIEANDRALETYGYTREEMLGLPLTALIAPEDIPSYQARLGKIQQKGMVVAEAIHKRKDGSTLPVEISGRTIEIEGKPYIQQIIRDITERKQAEDKMQHLTLVLRAIRNVNQLIARGVDRDGLFKGTCENFVGTRGYYNAWIALLDESGKLVTAAEAGLGKKFRQMTERLKHGEMTHCGREVLKKSGVVVIEDAASECGDCPLAKDYSDRCGMSVRLEYGGKVYGLMTVSTPSGVGGEKEELDLFEEVAGDISFALYSMEQEEERKKAEEALAGEATRRRILIEQSRDGIVVLDEDGKVYEANKRFAEMLGYSPDEVRDLSVWDWEFLYPREQVQEMIRTVDEKGDHFETRHRRKDGTIYDVEISTNGAIVGGQKLIFCVCRDITERKQAEQALADEAARRRILFDQSRDGIVVLDEDASVVEANKRFAEMLGYSPEKVRELHTWDWDTQFTREELLEMGRSIDEAGIHLETKHRRKDGTLFDVDISINKVIFGGQRLIFCMDRDITERKKAEEALRLSEQNFRDSMENSPLGIRVLDKEGGKTIYANRALLDIYGYSSIDELEAVPREQRYTPESYKEHMERLRKRKRGEYVPYSYEVGIVRGDGQVRYVLMSRGELLWNGQKRFQLFYQDITEREKMAGALQASEAQYRLLAEHMSDVVWMMDLDLNPTWISPSTAKARGYSLDEIFALPLDRQLTPESLGKAVNLLGKWIHLEQEGRTPDPSGAISLELEFTCKDGHTIWLECLLSFIRDEQGKAVGILGEGRDITERKLVEDEKRQLEQKAEIASRLASVGEMAAGIAHEINNPLTGVIGYAQLLTDRKDIPLDIKSDLVAINEGAQRVAGIVSRLLAFSRQTKLERRLVSVNELIESTLALRDYHLRVNNIKVVTRFASDVPETVADPGQLQQVFLNLIVNAETEMKLAHNKGRLTITTEKSDNKIRICFEDNGPGIEPQLLNRIFDPFFTTREVGQGTGLGLSLSYGIVTEHKGRIYAESKKGKGASFIVELPIVTEVELLKPPEPVAEEPEGTVKAKILVVDDEQVVRDLVERVLADEGYTVDTEDNADDALKKIESKRYNLILLDMKMPGKSGIELYGSIQKIARSLARRVVFITGDVMAADTEKFLSETKVPHIAKPFDAEQLRREVKRVLTRGR